MPSARPRGRTAEIFVTGDKEVDALLRSAPLNLQKKYLAKASQVVVKKIVMPRAVATAPVSDPDKKKSRGQSGDLRRGIKAYRMRTRKGQLGWRLRMGPPAYHAGLIELGTSERFTKKTGAARGQIAKPSPFAFLRKALYENEQIIRAKFLEFVAAFVRSENTKLKTIRHLIPK